MLLIKTRSSHRCLRNRESQKNRVNSDHEVIVHFRSARVRDAVFKHIILMTENQSKCHSCTLPINYQPRV